MNIPEKIANNPLLLLLFKPTLIILSIVFTISGQCQTIRLDGNAGGKRFDGIGAVSGGGATTVLLKDYPEPQRGQVLDYLFKPKFGASISALLVEIPGDGNSTQGSEPSHMHTRSDLNYYRGYEWWLMSEAKKRNPLLSLDANVWGSPKWTGDGSFWTQDMCDYDLRWIEGLKNVYGLDLDAIGCRNEKGFSEDYVKKLRATLNAGGFPAVKIHGFDNWEKNKFVWSLDLLTDSVLRASVDILSAHTMFEMPASQETQKISEKLNKPIWNSEEHVYLDGFDCEISLVQAFNANYIVSGATKIVNWYLVGSTYPIEPYAEKPAMMIAHEPWSGNFYTREVIWGYAHYGQFSEIGWQYLNGACGNLKHGGSYVTLKSPQGDYSIITETKGAKEAQKISFKVSGGLSNGKLCVWRSNASEQFVKLADITPVNGQFDFTFEPGSIYSISTTTGQQKGSFAEVPVSKPFPFPYYETFDEYKDVKEWGCIPHFTADIAGVFELADRPDKKGKCLKQVVGAGSQSWAPEWSPYTILGNADWNDYEVSADVNLNAKGWAGVMGRVSGTGYGYGSKPDAYYITLAANGACSLYVSKTDEKTEAGKLLAKGKAVNISSNQWHRLSLSFNGNTITGFVDKVKVLTATDTTFAKGMAGLITGSASKTANEALFDNLYIGPEANKHPVQTVFSKDVYPMYGAEKKN